MSTPSNATGASSAFENAFGLNKEGGNTSVSFQIGASLDDKIDVALESSSAENLYTDQGSSVNLSVDSAENAQKASEVLQNAIQTVTGFLANVGALRKRFQYAMDGIAISQANQDAARSTYMDADVPEVSSEFAKNMLLSQMSTAMLAQSSQINSGLMRLFQ